MPKKEKQPLTIKQKKNRARITQYSLFGSEFLAVATPYAIMAGVNANEWFIQNPEPWKIGLGGALGLGLMSLAVFLVAKKKENAEIKNGYIALIIGWYAVAFIFLMLARLMNEIYTIMFYGGFGLITALGLDIGSKHYKKVADSLKDDIDSASKDINKEQAKIELQKEAIKKENKKSIPVE